MDGIIEMVLTVVKVQDKQTLAFSQRVHDIDISALNHILDFSQIPTIVLHLYSGLGV